MFFFKEVIKPWSLVKMKNGDEGVVKKIEDHKYTIALFRNSYSYYFHRDKFSKLLNLPVRICCFLNDVKLV